MSKKIKSALTAVIGIAVIIGVISWYWVSVTHRFAVITERKVYKSGTMPYKDLKKIIEKNKIKTIVDFRKPKYQKEINAEHANVQEIGCQHFNIPSNQIPKDETVKAFLKIMDDEKNYPVLLHCYHGEGRAVLYSAIYRIEYEKWDTDKARCASKIIIYGTSFSLKESKGKYLNNYVPRYKRAIKQINKNE